jgi:putative transposase
MIHPVNKKRVMIFEQGHLYHIYNQGNNRQRIFFCRENYLFFLDKINKHVLPYADVLAWCLMPNHFHFMVHINAVSVSVGVTPSAEQTSHPDTKNLRTFNDSIGIMLRSYTRAINNQEKRTGALFREETKANCLTQVNTPTRAYYVDKGVTSINIPHPEDQYPNICFNYINFNPIKDGIEKRNEDWEFSSYPDIVGLRNGKLISKERIAEFGLKLI